MPLNEDLFKNSARTVKKTQHFTTLTKISFLMLFKEIIAVYSDTHTKDISTTALKVTDC
jgi:hypothetical protein